MALIFPTSGGNEVVECGVGHLTDPFTLAFWCKLTSFGGFAAAAVVASGAPTRLRLTDAGGGLGRIVTFVRGTGGDWNYISDTGFSQVDIWQCIVFQFDSSRAAGDQVKILHGTLNSAVAEVIYITETDGSGFDANTGEFVLGNNESAAGGADGSLRGRMARAALWSRFLSLTELRQWQFNSNICGANLVLRYELGYNGTGPQHDLSGNGNVGTVVGAGNAGHINLANPFTFPFEDDPYLVSAAISGHNLLLSNRRNRSILSY